jgi:hypothetical protein
MCVWIGETARIVHMVYELKTYIVDNVDYRFLYCSRIKCKYCVSIWFSERL